MKKQRKERFSTKSAGINGILRKSKKTQQAENKALSEAFSDLDALMKNAMQIVRLSTRIQASMEEKMKNMSDSQDKANSDFDSHDKNTNNDRSRGRNNADTHRKGGGDRKRQCEKLAKENDEFNQMLHFMGIPSPVTRDTAGSQYHIELSRQLADFLHEPLYVVYINLSTHCACDCEN